MHAEKFFMLLLLSADIFKISKFQIFFLGGGGDLYQCQTVWIKIRTDILSVLNCVHSVYKGYQQTIKVATSKKELIEKYTDRSLERFDLQMIC